MTRKLITATATLAVLLALPAAAAATPARPVGQVPMTAGERLTVHSVSGDGARVLVSRGPAAGEQAMWALNTATGATSQLGTVPFADRADLSAAGDWAAWYGHKSRRCGGAVTRGRADGTEPAQVIARPGRYARMAVMALTVGTGGRVTVLVGRCRGGYEPSDTDLRAILTADPGSASFRVVVQTRSDRAKWAVSQTSSTFAMCRPTRVSARRATGELTVVDAAGDAAVRTARLAYNFPRTAPTCAASDAGTGTLLVVRRRPGRATGRPRDLRVAGITTGQRAFQLPYGIGFFSPFGGDVAASPSGDQLLVGADTKKAYVLDAATGRRGKAIDMRRWNGAAYSSNAFGSRFAASAPIFSWHPFASTLVLVNRGTRRHSDLRVNIIDPRTATFRQRAIIDVHPTAYSPRLCFLPSGRILFEARASRSADASRAVLSDLARTAFAALDMTGLGTVTSVSCDAAAAGKVLAAAANGVVYELAADAIDGSPLTTY